MSAIVLHLTHMPPSVNECFRNIPGKGRVKVAKYKKWLVDAGWEVRAAMAGVLTMSGPVEVAISLFRPTANSDLDNRIKALLDLLQQQRVIRDDKQVHRLVAEWRPEPGVTVKVFPYQRRAA